MLFCRSPTFSILTLAPPLQKPNLARPTKLHPRTVQTIGLLHQALRVGFAPLDSDCLEHVMTFSAAHFMGNGKDFFLELRKQIAALQRGGPPVGG